MDATEQYNDLTKKIKGELPLKAWPRKYKN